MEAKELDSSATDWHINEDLINNASLPEIEIMLEAAEHGYDLACMKYRTLPEGALLYYSKVYQALIDRKKQLISPYFDIEHIISKHPAASRRSAIDYEFRAINRQLKNLNNSPVIKLLIWTLIGVLGLWALVAITNYMAFSQILEVKSIVRFIAR